MNLTPKQQIEAQAYLLDVKAYAESLRAHEFAFLPSHVCIHLAPDMCWLSVEHEYQQSDLGNDVVEYCNRKPQPCHIVLAKI